jgi:hypothetical protein
MVDACSFCKKESHYVNQELIESMLLICPIRSRVFALKSNEKREYVMDVITKIYKKYGGKKIGDSLCFGVV